jgi:hypothetical protein
MMSAPARPTTARSVDTAQLAATAGRVGAVPADRLAFAVELGSDTAPIAPGTAGPFLATLTTVAAVDVALARTVEPHLDALGILAQAGIEPDSGSTWGVFAAEAPGARLDVVRPGGPGAPLALTGTKPWCSLASSLSHALVTAHDGADRVLVAVDLRQTGVTVHDEAWVARGMPDVPSGPVDFDAVPCAPVGEPGWYLDRPGFAWGGIGVAACWYGGALGLARLVRARAAERAGSELAEHAVGTTALALADAGDALTGAAAAIDAGEADDAVLLAQLVRSRVRVAAERILSVARDVLGPGPLTSDAAIAARVADLELYLMQDHGARDVARIGRLVLRDGGPAW